MKRCLSENEIAQSAEWLAEINNAELPDDIKDHLVKCIDCRMEVGENFSLNYSALSATNKINNIEPL